jgi:hypothetical protein
MLPLQVVRKKEAIEPYVGNRGLEGTTNYKEIFVGSQNNQEQRAFYVALEKAMHNFLKPNCIET